MRVNTRARARTRHRYELQTTGIRKRPLRPLSAPAICRPPATGTNQHTMQSRIGILPATRVPIYATAPTPKQHARSTRPWLVAQLCKTSPLPRIRRIHHRFGREGTIDAIAGTPLPSPRISAKVLGSRVTPEPAPPAERWWATTTHRHECDAGGSLTWLTSVCTRRVEPNS